MNSALLARVAPRLRCLACGGHGLAPSPENNGGLVCPACRHVAPDRGGWIDLIGTPPAPSLAARIFLSDVGARAYDVARESPIGTFATGRAFRDEARDLVAALALPPSPLVIDVPCGQGNFTVPVARAAAARAGDVVAIDLAPPMLTRAALRLKREAVSNVVLLRASALDLPIVDGAAAAISTCGGFHLYPDVPRALGEIRRVLTPGGRVAGLTMRAPDERDGWISHLRLRGPIRGGGGGGNGLTLIDMDVLAEQARAAGLCEWHAERGRVVGYFRGRV